MNGVDCIADFTVDSTVDSTVDFIADFIIVGSGFGGSVSAMRLAQKGYKVVVIEMGKRWKNSDFPKSNRNIWKYLWMPVLRCFGIQKITFLKKLMVLHGIGVGGGSLVYANTLMQPHDEIFNSPYWPKNIDWACELLPFYKTAKKMLGVVTNPVMREGDLALKAVGEKMGVGDTFHPTEVGIYFGASVGSSVDFSVKKVPDPFFSGDGMERAACTVCGACMIGCPTGAKNTLDKNYLYFAEKWGAQILPETMVTRITPDENGYVLNTKKSTAFFSAKGPTLTAKNVILSAGVLGTLELLLKNRNGYETLPGVSDKLGEMVRTNGECLLGVTSFDPAKNLSSGIAIGAAIHPDAHTKIEGVRYPAGSDLMRLLAVPLTSQGGALVRPLKLLWNCFIKLPQIFKLLTVMDWARSTLILLVMQSTDTKMRLSLGRSFFSLFRLGLKVAQNVNFVSYIPIAQKTAELLGGRLNGFPQNIISEVLLQTPATAHVLGGAVIASLPQEGVVDTNHEVFGHKGLYICDASVIPANLAVNPSLTITALAERFASKFPVNPAAGNWKTPEIHFTNPD